MAAGRLGATWGLVLALVLVGVACGSDDGDPFLVWTHDQEPPDLHLDDPTNGQLVTSWIRSALLEGLYGTGVDTDFHPELLATEAELVANDDGSVTINYTLRDDLVWSDGEPLTTADVLYTWDVLRDGCGLDDDGTIVDSGEGCIYLRGARLGLNLITAVTAVDDTRFSVDLVGFFAGYKGLFGEIYAAHAFGADAAEVNENLRVWQNNEGVLPSSGPMTFAAWDRGVSLTMERNDRYHGSNSPDARNRGVAEVAGVRIDFVADTDAQINALKAGEAHIIMTQPQPTFGDRLTGDENFTVASSAGPSYEHWGFNLLNVHLADPRVREALAYAIDKGQVVTGLYAPMFGDVLPAAGLGNVFWMSNQAAYVDHQVTYAGPRFDEARAKLEEAGYTRGDDGIYAHPERGRLRLRVGTTGGNRLRELQQELIQAHLAEAGIEIVIDNVAGNAYLVAQPFHPDALAASRSGGTEGDPTLWDIAQFAFAGGPWPGGIAGYFLSGSPNNPWGYANPDFDGLQAVCDATIDDTERADCYNEMDRHLTTLELGDDGLVIVPLTQKPFYFGYVSSVIAQAGMAHDAPGAGPLVNVVDFRFDS